MNSVSSLLAVNIHSHWGGALLFAYLLCVHLPSILAIYDTDAAIDLFYLLVFGLAAIACLFFSGTYHMAACHSPEVPSLLAASQAEGIDTQAGREYLSQTRLLRDFNPHSGLNVPLHVLLLLLSSKLP